MTIAKKHHKTSPFQGLDDGLRVLFWNAGGLNNAKFTELKTIIHDSNADVYIIAEAGASTDAPLFYNCTDYTTFVLPRSRQVASGIIVGVSNNACCKFAALHTMTDTDKHEAVLIEVWSNGSYYKVIGVYNPPANNLRTNLIDTASRHHNSIIIGDFNAHSPRWGYCDHNAAGYVMENLIETTQLIHMRSEPTFLSYIGSTSTPDLCLVSANLSGRATLKLENAVEGHGHRILSLFVRPKGNSCKKPRLPRWNFKKADWEAFKQTSNQLLTPNIINDNPDQSTFAFEEAIQKTAKSCIPRGFVKKYKPFWSESLSTLQAERNKARKKAESTKNHEDCITLRKRQAELKKEIIQSKRATYRNFVANLDFRKDGIKAHHFISSLNNEKRHYAWEPVTVNGKTLTSPAAVAQALCKYYAAVSTLDIRADDRAFIKQQNTNLSDPIKPTPVEMNNPFLLHELESAIRTLKNGKSAGPDEIFPEFIKHLGETAKLCMLKLINLTWAKWIPHQWKRAEIISIHKKGKPRDNLASYRPISLTNVCCKVAEKMVESRLRNFIEDRGAINDAQAGFRKNRSTTDQLVKFTQAVKDGFHRKQSTVAVLIDFKAAYDKVWKQLLVSKLAEIGVAGNMLTWIKNFLTQRLIRTKFLNVRSKFKTQKQGLPQGAVLSCLLFNIMINDLTAAIEKTPGVSYLLYADDVIIWSTSSNTSQLEMVINQALKNIEAWADRNKMTVNADKTVFQLFTLSTKPPKVVLKYKQANLPESKLSKYLGVSLDSKLSWKKHIEEVADRASRRTNLLKRLTGTKWGCTQDVLATAYKTYVRPTMEYAAAATALASKPNLKKLDKIQNNALRIVTGAAFSTPIGAMEVQTRTEPLEVRRDKLVLKFWERSRRVDHRLWSNYRQAAQRLKTQLSPLQHAEDLRKKYNIPNSPPGPLKTFHSLPDYAPLIKLSLIDFRSTKQTATPEELKQSALATIHSLYPETDWLHVYTDGSKLTSSGVGAGAYCRIFQISQGVGADATNFDGEITAVKIAADQLATYYPTDRHPRAVFLVDSQAAIIAIADNSATTCPNLHSCREAISHLLQTNWTICLQWVPSHVGIAGNERADELAKNGAQLQQPYFETSLLSAKHHIDGTIKQSLIKIYEEDSRGKKWATLITSPLRHTADRASSVADFRLLTGHDYLQAHLHRFGLAESDICPLCQGGIMNADHLNICPKLDDQLSRCGRYWEARRQMAQQPRAGIG